MSQPPGATVVNVPLSRSRVVFSHGSSLGTAAHTSTFPTHPPAGAVPAGSPTSPAAPWTAPTGPRLVSIPNVPTFVGRPCWEQHPFGTVTHVPFRTGPQPSVSTSGPGGAGTQNVHAAVGHPEGTGGAGPDAFEPTLGPHTPTRTVEHARSTTASVVEFAYRPRDVQRAVEVRSRIDVEGSEVRHPVGGDVRPGEVGGRDLADLGVARPRRGDPVLVEGKPGGDEVAPEDVHDVPERRRGGEDRLAEFDRGRETARREQFSGHTDIGIHPGERTDKDLEPRR